MSAPLSSDVIAALTDPQILTLTLYGEARGEPIEGQIAVACLIRNRTETGRWGASYAKVCLHPWQFSCWRPEGGQQNYDRVIGLAKELATSTHLPEDPQLRQCAWVAQGVIGHWIQDTTKDATHYYAPRGMTPPERVPAWAINKQPVVTIGHHLFFAGIL